MIQIYLVIALVFAVVTGGGALYIKALRAENATMTQAYGIAAQTAIDNKAQLDQEIKDRARVDGILADRERALHELEKTNDLLNLAIDDLGRADPEVRKWDNEPVPAALRSLLNGPDAAHESGSAEAVPAGQPDPAHIAAPNLHPH